MKRFYKQAGIQEAEGGFHVCLDGKPVRTPAKAPMLLPTQALAQAIADEWEAQDDKIIPDSMPQMTLAATAIDRVIPNAGAVAEEAAGYAGSDLLCYRADGPEDLVARQVEGWDPVLDWAQSRYDVRFAVTAGLMPVDQPAETVERFQAVAKAVDPFALTALHVLTSAFGSFILALAVLEEERSPADAFALSRIDETHQEELWGIDEEAAARKDRLSREVEQAKRYLDLLGSS